MTIFRILIFLAALLLNYAAQAQDTREISTAPREIYGNQTAEIGIKIGNGGAGPTGIIRALAEDYLKMTDAKYSIAWYQDISVNALQQLRNEVIDIALVYEKNQGEEAQKQGWATNYTPVFNDHFLIIGPKSNPAQIEKTDPLNHAFKKIAYLGKERSAPTFISRDDNSGTNIREQTIWKMINLKPWQEEKNWYVKQHVFPQQALIYADQNSLYTITDYGTFLSNKSQLKNSQILIKSGKLLINPCFALLGRNPSREAKNFLDYLKSERAQNLIADFGKDKFGGKALFTKTDQEEF